MNQPNPNAAVSRDFALSTPNRVDPKGTGMIFHKAEAVTIVHDIKPGPSAAIDLIYAGQREIRRSEGQTWSDAIDKIQLQPGQTITVVAQNVGTERTALTASFLVEEQAIVLPADVPSAPTPQKQFGFGAERPAVRTVGANAAPVNTPFVRRTPSSGSSGSTPTSAKQTTEVVQGADGATRKVIRTVLPPIAQRSPEVAAQIRANGGNPNAPRGGGGGQNQGGRAAPRRSQTVRASGKAPARVNPPRFHGGSSAVVSTSAASTHSPASVQTSGRTRVIRSGASQTAPVTNAATNTAALSANNARSSASNGATLGARTMVVMPPDGAFTVALLAGHAERLLLRVEQNIALPKMFKPSLTRALASANTEPRTAGGNDVVVCVDENDLRLLRQLVIAGGLNLDAEARERLGRAIRRGLSVVRGEVQETAAPNVVALAPPEAESNQTSAVSTQVEERNEIADG